MGKPAFPNIKNAEMGALMWIVSQRPQSYKA